MKGSLLHPGLNHPHPQRQPLWSPLFSNSSPRPHPSSRKTVAPEAVLAHSPFSRACMEQGPRLLNHQCLREDEGELGGTQEWSGVSNMIFRDKTPHCRIL